MFVTNTVCPSCCTSTCLDKTELLEQGFVLCVDATCAFSQQHPSQVWKSDLKTTSPVTQMEKEGWAEGFRFGAQLTRVGAICFFHTAGVTGRLSAVTSSFLDADSSFHNLQIIEVELFYILFFDFLLYLLKNNVISGEVLKGLNVVTKHLRKIFSLKYVNIFLSVVQIAVFNFAEKSQRFLFIFTLKLCSYEKTLQEVEETTYF